MGEEGVPKVDEFVEEKLPEGGCIGFDGRVVNGSWGKKLSGIAEKKHATLYVEEDLIDLIWKDRPALSKKPVFILKEQYSGKSTKDKLAALREAMKEEVANIVNRDFHAEQPNEKWLTDLTEFSIPAGKVYLSPIIVPLLPPAPEPSSELSSSLSSTSFD